MTTAAVQRRTSLSLVRSLAIAAIAFAILLAAGPAQASARTWNGGNRGDGLYALTASGQLLVVDRSRPGSVHERMRITGLARGEWLVGIDVRPATGDLYAIGSTNQLYMIDGETGQATRVGGKFSPGLQGTSFGFDFNPVVDRIRLVSNTGQNLRLHPDTGAVAAIDGDLAFASGDPYFGNDAEVVAAAYSNNVAGTTTTTLYGLEASRNLLVTQAPPNDGVLNTVGTLRVVSRGLPGFNGSSQAGFDILTTGGDNWAYVALRSASSRSATLYMLDLGSGTLRSVGVIGNRDIVVDIAVMLD